MLLVSRLLNNLRTLFVTNAASACSYMTRVMRRLKLSGVSHHTMRHTGVTLMLEAGINPRVIQKLAGWTSLRMLERYGHARDAEALRAVTLLRQVTESAQKPAQGEKPELLIRLKSPDFIVASPTGFEPVFWP